MHGVAPPLSNRAISHGANMDKSGGGGGSWIDSTGRGNAQFTNDACRNVNSLKIWIMEMKGAPAKKRIYCHIHVNGEPLQRTTAKLKLDILFWGEWFNFTDRELPMQITSIEVRIYKESDKKKKNKETNLLGTVDIPIGNISGAPFETWYPIRVNSKTCDANSTLRVKALYQTVEILQMVYYNELLEFIVHHSMALYKMIEDLVLLKEKEEFSASLIQVLYTTEGIDQFFADVIEFELSRLENPRMVFRGNTLATKSMEAYLKFIGARYLQETLKDTIQEIYRNDAFLEIDPCKITNSANLAGNCDSFKRLCESIWKSIFDSRRNFPWEIRCVFAKIKERLQPSYSKDVIDNIITGSVFLRFICPAIMTPNLFCLHNAYPPDNAARTLTLLAKLLQSLANLTSFGEKEGYMMFMNQFMDEQFPSMRTFLEIISTAPADNLPHPATDLAQKPDVAKELAILYKMLVRTTQTLRNSAAADTSAPSELSQLPPILGNIARQYTNAVHQNNPHPAHYLPQNHDLRSRGGGGGGHMAQEMQGLPAEMYQAMHQPHMSHHHHVNSTLPRSHKLQPGVSMFPPPSNYPPHTLEDNYENMEILKMSARQNSGSPLKKNSSNSSTSTVHSSDIANPTEPVERLLEHAHKVRLYPEPSTPQYNLQSQSQPVYANHQAQQASQLLQSHTQKSEFKPKSRLGISSLPNHAKPVMATTPTTPLGPGGTIYDAADEDPTYQARNTQLSNPPSSSDESKFRPPVRQSSSSDCSSITSPKTPTSEGHRRASRENIHSSHHSSSRSPKPSSMPVQIMPVDSSRPPVQKRGAQCYTPTQEQQMLASAGDVALDNPIYDVYPAAAAQAQYTNGAFVPDPSTESTPHYNNVGDVQRSAPDVVSSAAQHNSSSSSDDDSCNLSETSNLQRVQSDSSFPLSTFPSELDLLGGGCSTPSTSNHNPPGEAAGGDSERESPNVGTPDEMMSNDSLDNVFVPTSTDQGNLVTSFRDCEPKPPSSVCERHKRPVITPSSTVDSSNSGSSTSGSQRTGGGLAAAAAAAADPVPYHESQASSRPVSEYEAEIAQLRDEKSRMNSEWQHKYTNMETQFRKINESKEKNLKSVINRLTELENELNTKQKIMDDEIEARNQVIKKQEERIASLAACNHKLVASLQKYNSQLRSSQPSRNSNSTPVNSEDSTAL